MMFGQQRFKCKSLDFISVDIQYIDHFNCLKKTSKAMIVT